MELRRRIELTTAISPKEIIKSFILLELEEKIIRKYFTKNNLRVSPQIKSLEISIDYYIQEALEQEQELIRLMRKARKTNDPEDMWLVQKAFNKLFGKANSPYRTVSRLNNELEKGLVKIKRNTVAHVLKRIENRLNKLSQKIISKGVKA